MYEFCQLKGPYDVTKGMDKLKVLTVYIMTKDGIKMFEIGEEDDQ